MIKDLELMINEHKRVLLLGAPGVGKSQSVRLLLSENAIQNRVIVETKEEVDFIKRNLILEHTISFESYQKKSELFNKIKGLNNQNKPFIAVLNETSLIKTKEVDINLFQLIKEHLLERDQLKGIYDFLYRNFDLIIFFERKELVRFFFPNSELPKKAAFFRLENGHLLNPL